MNLRYYPTLWIISSPFILAFWYSPSRAPLFQSWGDVVRGWPLGYGLDQGDVRGDEYAFMVTYFDPISFCVDALIAIGIGFIYTLLLYWLNVKKNKCHY